MGMNYFRDFIDGNRIYNFESNTPEDQVTLGQLADLMLVNHDERQDRNGYRLSREGTRFCLAIKQNLSEFTWLDYEVLIRENPESGTSKLDEIYNSGDMPTDAYEFFRSLKVYNFDNTWDETFVGKVEEYLNTYAKTVLIHDENGLTRIPQHWECPDNFTSLLPEDEEKLATVNEAIRAAYANTNTVDRMNPYVPYKIWQSLVGLDVAEDALPVSDPLLESIVNMPPAEISSQLRGMYRQRQLTTGSQTRPSVNNGINTLNTIQGYVEDIRNQYDSYITNVMLDAKNREITRVNAKYSGKVVDFSKKLNIASELKYLQSIDKINENDNCKWWIYKNPDTYGGPTWFAVSKEIVTIQGTNHEDYGDATDEEFCYGHIVVVFNKAKVLKVHVGGLGNVLSGMRTPCHPHKDYNHDTGFCWGNIGGQVIMALTGDHQKLSGSQTDRACDVNTNLEVLTQAAIHDIQEDKLEAQVLGELEGYFRIYDLEAYLNLVWQILAFADYGNPYLHLSHELLDNNASDWVNDLGASYINQNFDSAEDIDEDDEDSRLEHECFEDYVLDMNVQLEANYRNSVDMLYASGKGDLDKLRAAKEHYTNYLLPSEVRLYDVILSGGTQVAEPTTSEIAADIGDSIATATPSPSPVEFAMPMTDSRYTADLAAATAAASLSVDTLARAREAMERHDREYTAGPPADPRMARATRASTDTDTIEW